MVSSTSRRPFEFVANHIVLDFINTVNARPTFTRDDLACADDIVDWGRAAGVLDGDRQIERRAASAAQFEATVALREGLFRLFGPIAIGHEPQARAVEWVTRRAADAIHSADWRRHGACYEPTWPLDSIASLRDRLADEALQLLRSSAVARIRSCDGCGWLFLDTSRAHGRRWCSMNACGARHKMRRYHQRRAVAAAAS
jgi:predicted RNA-binding Zn ribbon-like protein